MLDPTFSQSTTVGSAHAQLRIHLGQPDSPVQWWVGDGTGHFQLCHTPDCPTQGVDWEVVKKITGDDVNPDLSLEIRISLDLLGSWAETDGLALAQTAVNGPGSEGVSPNIVHNSPATWHKVTYSDAVAGLGQAQATGKVWNGYHGTQTGRADHLVTLIAGSLQYTQTTMPDGTFDFDVPVPPGQIVRVQANGCNFCRYDSARVSHFGIRPTSVSTLAVTFEGCAAGPPCPYAYVNFLVVEPPAGPVSFTGFTPESPVASMILRESSRSTTVSETVTITGTNLHELVKVYLSPQPVSGTSNDWVLYETQITARASDQTTLTVKMPSLPKWTQRDLASGISAETLNTEWRWVIEDTWLRPDVVTWNTSSPFLLTPPLYPQLHGFGFDNEDDTPTLDEFLAVYGNNAYICLGALDVCVTRILDPLYSHLWFLVYYLWIDNSGGSCVGMSSTSQLIYHGDLQMTSYHANVAYPFGFREADIDRNAQWNYSGMLGALTGPPAPANLWAQIRMNHGVQTSAEFIWEVLGDLDANATIDVDEIIGGSPVNRYNELTSNPTNQIVSMMSGDGSGHVVTPYGTSPSRIWVYDNNDPGDQERYINISPTNDTYGFPRTDGTEWNGDLMFTIPIDVWRNERHAPLDLGDIVVNLVFGAADGLYTTSDGNYWGWQPDGTFANEMPGARWVTPMGDPANQTRTIPLFLPLAKGAPSIQVNSRGGDYLYYSGQGGHLFQLQVFNGVAGATDAIQVDYENNRLSSFRFALDQDGPQIVPKVGLNMGERERALFRWHQLNIQGSDAVAFKANREQRAVEFTNETSQDKKHYLVLDTVDGASETHGTSLFGPFSVPKDAVHRTTIADWPMGKELLSEIDRDGDGIFETSTSVTGQDCSSDDEDGNAIPDACEQLASDPSSLTPEGSDTTRNNLYLPLVIR